MLIYSYNLSPALSSSLKKIDKLRSDILLTPLTHSQTSSLTWKATLKHLSGWAHLANQPINEKIITDLVNGNFKVANISSFTKKAVSYLEGLNHLWLEWIANPKPVTHKHIQELSKVLDVSYNHEPEIISLLGYVQTGAVHPIIQAAIVHLYFYPNRIAYIASLLFIYKGGFDLKRMLAMEEFWQADKLNYLATLQNASKLGQITLWLEYYCDAVSEQMENLKKNLANPIINTLSKFNLSTRQRQILSYLQIPGATITNRQIQSLLNTTQVTASRDLSGLTKKYLIMPHGHGRSISYSLI